jgi:hypothetical protein
MDFVYDIDFVFSLIGFEACSFDELTDIVDSSITRCIDLDDIEHSFIIERETVCTGVARISIFYIGTVDRLGEDACTRRLPSSTRTMKEVCMADATTSEAISEDLRDVVLTDD